MEEQKNPSPNEVIGSGVNTSDQTVVKQYFKYYAKLVNQQNMMQDEIRTKLYRDAIEGNKSNFEGKVVMDVGCGSGILSMFAARAGASKVYAVEASQAADHAKKLIAHNGFSSVIEVIQARIEDITEEMIPGDHPIDVIISEPLGIYLLNERMLETYVIARDKFLKPGGRMFPTKADLCIQPFSDQVLYDERKYGGEFWLQKNFHDIDLSSLHMAAVQEKLNQPVLDTLDPSVLISAKPYRKMFDFEKCTLEDIKHVKLEFEHTMQRTALLHGYVMYFDAYFDGDDKKEILHTGPLHPATHWYQTYCLFEEPVGVNRDQVIKASIEMKANNEQAFDTKINLNIPQIKVQRIGGPFDMKDPEYRGSYQSYGEYVQQE